MNRSNLLASRIREVFLNGKWIANTNFKEQIESITWKQAVNQVHNLNTIALLTFHVNYYLGGLIDVLNGGNLEIHDKYSFDLPELKSEAEWKKLINDFLRNAELFSVLVGEMNDEKLDEIFVKQEYGTYLRNIEGIIEHSYYHLGQISLIRKMVN